MSAIFTSKERLYLNADKTKVCREGDPEADSLLIHAGGEIPIAVARRYGLTGEDVTNTEPEPVKGAQPRKNRTVTSASIERR